MYMGKKLFKLFFLLIVIDLFMITSLYSQEGRGWYQLHKMVNKMEQLTIFDRVDIIFALQDGLRDTLPVDYLWKANEVDGIRSLILTGFSFELSATKIANACSILFEAYQNGAVHPEVLDFFDLVFASQISGERLALISRIANDLQIFSDEQKMVLIAEFVNNNHPGNAILHVVDFLKNAHAEKLDPDKFIITALSTLRKSDKTDIGEQLNLLLAQLKDEKEKEIKILVYVSIAGNFKKQKLPNTFLDNLAVKAVNTGWSKKMFIHLLKTLDKAAKKDMHYEKLKMSITHRLSSAQNLSDDFVKSVCEQEYKQMNRQVAQLQKRELSNKKPEGVSEKKLKIGVKKNKVIAVLNSYIGTPYCWGGTSYRGIDCSGLTQQVLWKCGVQIPRTSRLQYQRGQNINMSL